MGGLAATSTWALESLSKSRAFGLADAPDRKPSAPSRESAHTVVGHTPELKEHPSVLAVPDGGSRVVMSLSKRRQSLGTAVMTAAALLALPSNGQSPTPSSKPTVVYTEAQAGRGAKIYEENCAACHGADLAGAPGAPSLSGADFSFGWSKKTAGELYDFVHANMPPGEPGWLEPQAYADLVAVILKANRYPAGGVELKPDAEAMTAMPLAKP